jgi:hypothetical protein
MFQTLSSPLRQQHTVPTRIRAAPLEDKGGKEKEGSGGEGRGEGEEYTLVIFPALTSDVFFGAMVREPFFACCWEWDLVRGLEVVVVGFFAGPWAIFYFERVCCVV